MFPMTSKRSMGFWVSIQGGRVANRLSQACLELARSRARPLLNCFTDKAVLFLVLGKVAEEHNGGTQTSGVQFGVLKNRRVPLDKLAPSFCTKCQSSQRADHGILGGRLRLVPGFCGEFFLPKASIQDQRKFHTYAILVRKPGDSSSAHSKVRYSIRREGLLHLAFLKAVSEWGPGNLFASEIATMPGSR